MTLTEENICYCTTLLFFIWGIHYKKREWYRSHRYNDVIDQNKDGGCKVKKGQEIFNSFTKYWHE